MPPGGVIGQNLSFTQFGPNGTTLSPLWNTPPASGSTLWGSFGAVYLSATKELFVADTNNNRAIVMPLAAAIFQSVVLWERHAGGRDRPASTSLR